MVSLCGAEVFFVGAVGGDVFGDQIKKNFVSLGVRTDHLITSSQAATGVAHIWVDGEGENRIVIIPGANLDLSEELAIKAIKVLDFPAFLISANDFFHKSSP